MLRYWWWVSSMNVEREGKVFQAYCAEGGRFDTTTSSILFTESDTKELEWTVRFVTMRCLK